MKYQLRWIFSSIILVISVILLASCEGPSGEDGLDGAQGPAGNTGQTGANANDQCKVCHNQTNHKLKVAQYNLSVHAAAPNLTLAGSARECARCHSHEGFVETVFTGRDSTSTNLMLATKIGCATCHDTHISFDTLADGKDFAMRVTDPVRMIASTDKSLVDFGSSSNGCATCHQPLYAAPVAGTDGKFKVPNSQYGPHSGTQAAILYGRGAYEVPGSVYPVAGSSSHFKNDACVACHIGKADGETGGHTFNASLGNCTTCHSNATNFDYNGIQTEVTALLTELESKLKSKGIIKTNGSIYPGNFPIDQVGAFYNYKLIIEDRSLGVHNPAYTKAILTNSINSIN